MAKITRKAYKRKKIVAGLGIFGGVALVSTGVVTWVVSRNVVDQEGSNIHVVPVEDSSMKILDIKITDTNDPSVETNDFSFAPPIDDDTGWVRWGKSTDETAFDDPERLSLTISGTVMNAQNLDKLTIKSTNVPAALSLTSTIVDENNPEEVEKSAVFKEYIVAPEVIYEEVEITNIHKYSVGNTTLAKFSFEFRFEWGYLFGGDPVNKIPGMNPSFWYDTEDGRSTLPGEKKAEQIAAVNDILNDMHDLLDNVSIELTITATPN